MTSGIRIKCPWCGTQYAAFQSNCSNCGGPLNLPDVEAESMLIAPPPAPRSISPTYAWRLLQSDGRAIAGAILVILSLVLSAVGAGLTLGVITAIVGVPFLMLGLALVSAGGGLLIWRYRAKQQIVQVLTWGEPVRGQIDDVHENLLTSINGRHPWLIEYPYQAGGQDLCGQVSTLHPPGPALQPGRPAYVLYLSNAPHINALYPHP